MSFRYTVSVPQWIEGKDAEGEAIVVSACAGWMCYPNTPSIAPPTCVPPVLSSSNYPPTHLTSIPAVMSCPA